MDLRDKPEVGIITLPMASRTSDTRPDHHRNAGYGGSMRSSSSLLYETALSSHHAGARPDTCDMHQARFLFASGSASSRASR